MTTPLRLHRAPGRGPSGERPPLSWIPGRPAGGTIAGAAGRLVRRAAQNIGLAATLALLAALFGLQALALLRAPASWLPAAIDITLTPGESITLGQRELAAPQTDRSHLSLRLDPLDGWLLRNISPSKQVILLRDSGEQRMGSVALRTRQSFQIDGAVFNVSASDPDTIIFSRDGHEWRYDGAVLYRDGHAQSSCPDARLSGRALSLWNRAMPMMLSIARPLSFGGNLYCGNRLGLAQTTQGAAQLSRTNGRLELSAGNPDGDRASVLVHGDGVQTDLRRQEASLAGVNAMIVGHTRFQLTPARDQLTLTPSRHVSLFNVPDLKLPAAVSWQWQQRSLWNSGHANALWFAVAGCLACVAIGAACAISPAGLWPRHAATGAKFLGATILLIAGAAALITQRAGIPPGAALSMALGACALLLWLAFPGRLTLLTAAGVVLLATGLLAQLELGLGAPQTSWLRYYQKSAAMLAIGAGLGGLLRLWAQYQAARAAHLQQRTIEWVLAIFAAIALAALAAQVLWGDETGVFDLQPVELAKLALTALTAHCLALRFGWHSETRHPADHRARWLQLIAPALLFVALLGLSLVQIDDFSPLILLLVWSTAMAFAYALAARHRLLTAALIAVSLLAVGAVAYLRLAGTDDLIRWGFYADRFLVWLNPAEHPHTGQQLLLGARAIGEGGWLGADHWLGLRALGQSAGGVVQIPAVQDDFAATFFINRHGLAGALLLWGVQAAFLTGIVLTALRAHHAGATARNFRQAWSGRFRYFALCGGGAFVLGHFLLSWGTNLAIFPIMGQPMSFLSAGGSHLLFFLCPLLAFSAISAQSLEGD
ncbi:cell division protein FtsW [Duganella sp. CF517]|uniref:FtsW/RodA/SpoVE family cell cycle protein n=1 Tax=Duganella sp. CF517 TaxID=1881038 RepID=UPI0008AF959C|nr:FtsW/RodA/SpoVE family cell cycle protein [Duganella sp. CF517]SEO07936.1 cell division protein FtsW [Duganella sp. CF517]